MRKLLISFILISFPAIAQLNIVVQSGLGLPSFTIIQSSQSNFLGEYWSNGINVAVGTEYALTERLYLVSSIEYSFYNWNNYNYQGAMIPEYHIRSSEGDDSHIYRLMLETHYFTSRNFLSIYFATGLGYTIEKIGSIRNIIDDMNGPSFISYKNFPNKNYWVHSVGIGLRANVVEWASIDVNARYYTDYNERFYTSYNLGLAFLLSE